MFVSIAWHLPFDFYRLIVRAAGNIPPKNASDIFLSLGILEARMPKFVGVIASHVGSNASDDRSEFTQAHTRSITSKMLWHIAWNRQELCIPNCLRTPKEIPRDFCKKNHHPREGPRVAPTHSGNIVIELKRGRINRLVTGMSDFILVNMSQFSSFFSIIAASLNPMRLEYVSYLCHICVIVCR